MQDLSWSFYEFKIRGYSVFKLGRDYERAMFIEANAIVEG